MDKPILFYEVRVQQNRTTGAPIYVPAIVDREEAVPLDTIIERAIDRGLIAGIKTSAAKQIADANRAWFVVGTYNELKEAGIVAKTGGFIGIGRKQGTVAGMSTERFTEIDRTKVTTITINKKKAVVISQHPEDSYELVADEENSSVTAYLRILNPTQFWKYTDYLVVSTK